jgi:hypothetical protein
MTYSLGVDLGAATCSAAARRGARIEPCALGETATTMPAVALPRADGSMLVGEPAEAACRFEPALAARNIAARLGEADTQPIVIDGQLVDPYALTEALIGTAIQRTTEPGAWPGHLVLTYPLRHGGTVEPVLERASARVTTGPVMLVPEPIAAMAKLTHDVELALDTTVAVIDFGGTSFDVTLVRRTETGFDLVGDPASLADFGGVDVDAAVLAHVEASIGDVTSQVRDDDHATMLALRRLRASCRAAKERLTTAHEAIVEVALPHARAQVQVTREDLERAIGAGLTTAVDLIAHTITDAGLAIPDVHVALLVGGSSRIPLLTRLITERIGLPIVADPLPELTVSLGAALFGEEDPAPALPVSAFDSLGAPIVAPLWPPPADLSGSVPAVAGPGGGVAGGGPPDGGDPDAIPLSLAGEDGAGSQADDPWAEAHSADVAPAWDQDPAPLPAPWDGGGRPPALWDAPAPGPSKERPWDEPWAQPWDGEDPATFDPFFAPRPGAAAAAGLAIGHEPDGAEDEFSRLTASDTDPFGTRSAALERLTSRPSDDEFDLGPDKDKRPDKGDGYGRSTDPRVVVGAIGAGLAIVLLGGFAVALGIGSDASGDGIAVGGITTTSMVAQTGSTAGTSTSASASTDPESTATEATARTTRTTTRTTTTTRRTTRTTVPQTQPQPPPPTQPPPTDPPPTTTPTTESPTTTSTTTTTTPTTTSSSMPLGP